MSYRQSAVTGSRTHAPRRQAQPARVGGYLTRRYEDLLACADIHINGSRPWDLTVHDKRFFRCLLIDGSLGLGESYVKGWWDAERLDQFCDHLIRAELDKRIIDIQRVLSRIRSWTFNLQTISDSRQVGKLHYDLGNDFYAKMLGPRMVYTCGYWRDAGTLEEAQEHKLDLVCRKLQLTPGMRVLDIGCGWGSFARFAAERYGVEVVGVTISEAQAALAREQCIGLPVEIRLQDYRAVEGRFERIVSLGMFEHVGRKNYRTFMALVERCLPSDGIFVLQTIGSHRSDGATNPWLTKYIFPNGEIPLLRHVVRSVSGLLTLEDLHNCGPDYDRTLMAWHDNFEKAWPLLTDDFPKEFYRMWSFYLLMSAGVFRARGLQLWQLVLVPQRNRGVYRRPAG